MSLITISRSMGCGGKKIASLIAEVPQGPNPEEDSNDI